MTAGGFKLKSVLILSFLLAWAVVSAAHVFFYAVAGREKYLAESRKIAWRESDIPYLRGAILDAEGVPLACSEISYDLVVAEFPKKTRRRASLLKLLARLFPEKRLDETDRAAEFVLKSSLAPEEIVKYTKAFRNFGEVMVKSRFGRKCHSAPALAEVIGKTAVNDAGDIVGVSGLEREHDLTLSGSRGRLSVMLDRHGNWLPETLRIIRPPVNGKDVRISFSIREKTGGAGLLLDGEGGSVSAVSAPRSPEKKEASE